MCYLKPKLTLGASAFKSEEGSIIYLVGNILIPSPFEIALRPIPPWRALWPSPTSVGN